MTGIRVVVSGSEEVIRGLGQLPAFIQDRVGRAIQGIGIELANRVKERKLSGQVLNVRTGRLRSSIVSRFYQMGGIAFATVGTNVVYGKFWEYGFHGVQQVRAHTRRIAGRDLEAGGLKLAEGVGFVRAHPRLVNVAARPFLRPTQEEMRDEARAKIMAAVRG